MVVITPPYHHPKEISLANTMLERGLPLLHIRKPDFTFEQLQEWIENISYQHHDKLVIHIPSPVINNYPKVFKQYVQLINSLKAQYAHLSTDNCSFVNNYAQKLPYLSTSVHNSTECEKLSTRHQRVFLSPVFDSISKIAYQPTLHWPSFLADWKYPWIQTVALGGITPDYLATVRNMGFDDFAVLGAIWQAAEPLKIFDLCYKQDQLLFR
ncbi:thiamine phosphate synthase [Myroides sp. TSA_177.3]|uniref:thiamine phosphate synthase n=1 Tax=Myroides sp. TSA_177.3 TaxID=3415650 RepID=UPI00404647F3